jgi:ATP-binding cassette subfamily B protein
MRVFSGIGMLIEFYGDIKNNAAYLKLDFQLIDMKSSLQKGTRGVEPPRKESGGIEFKNVSFKYPGTDDYVLKNVSIKFRPGSRLAAVGMNGSGKTTFIKLLCRLYDPTEGEILYNGVNIKEYDYGEYMRMFAVVFQDFYITKFKLGENVSSGPITDREKVEKCLESAGFADKLAEYEKGIDTYMGKIYDPDGVECSGGEAQKIAIARALYKDAPFIILDEPTASLDPIAEADIYSKFNDIAKGKSAIYISHRLSSCKFCDEIAVFHEGQIIQHGSHDELLSDEDGKYRQLWYAQAQYYQK